jgi:C-terminal processing protease CtpA/Prc
MKTLSSILSLAVLLGLAAVGLAGGDYKCDQPAQSCLDAMAAKYAERGWLGIETEKAGDAYAVSEVVAGSPAEAAGFRTGDVLVALNGIDFNSGDKNELKKVKSSLHPGTKVKYTVRRAGGETQLVATLGAVPEEVLAQWVGEHMLDQHSHVRVAAKD